MGRKNKLKKFAEVLNFPNVVENFDYLNPKLKIGANEEVDFKGRWSKAFFKNNNDLVLELACGRGEYAIALGREYPNRNFLGVDIKGARIWNGAKTALNENLTNVGFLRTRIEQIGLFIGEHEVDEIWLTFPDPFLLKERNRLTHHNFLNRYLPILKPGGKINLKTDNTVLYEYSLESFNSWGRGKILYHHHDIYSTELYMPELNHKTYYEKLHMNKGEKIKFIQYQIN